MTSDSHHHNVTSCTLFWWFKLKQKQQTNIMLFNAKPVKKVSSKIFKRHTPCIQIY